VHLEFGVLKLLWLCTCQVLLLQKLQFNCSGTAKHVPNWALATFGVASPQLVHVLPSEVWMLEHFEGGAGSALLL
jgi:hypothetical protein